MHLIDFLRCANLSLLSSSQPEPDRRHGLCQSPDTERRQNGYARQIESAELAGEIGAIMSVLEEIVQWAKDRPIWQRDALQRLFVAGELSPADMRELTSLCKASHGLAEYPAPDVLSKDHISLQKIDRKQIPRLPPFPPPRRQCTCREPNPDVWSSSYRCIWR